MLTLSRRPDWRPRLAGHITSARQYAFAWGTHDCAVFAADAVLVMTDVDPIAPWRGRCKDAASGRRILARGGGLEAMVDKLFADIPVALAQRGDWLLVPAADDSPAGLAVCDGMQAWGYMVGHDALSALPTAIALKAWRIG